MLHVATGATRLQVVSRHLCESQGFVQLASCQKPSVRGDGGSVEFQVYPAVELEFDMGKECERSYNIDNPNKPQVIFSPAGE